MTKPLYKKLSTKELKAMYIELDSIIFTLDCCSAKDVMMHKLIYQELYE